MFWSSKFNPVTGLSDLSGKVIVVTGANKGIGYPTVKYLARKGAKVYLGSRNEERGKAAVSSLLAEGVAPGEVKWFLCDISSPSLAKESAEDFLSREERLDILVNNAGQLADSADNLAQDGIPECMMTNYVGTFQFTKTLLPLLIKTSEEPGSDVRIVTVSSNSHRRVQASPSGSNIRFNTIDALKKDFKSDYMGVFFRYCYSKLAVTLFSSALQRRLNSCSCQSTHAVLCIAVHPGSVNTFSDRLPLPSVSNFILARFLKDVDDGAFTSCFAAASPQVKESVEKYAGCYLEPVGRITLPSEDARNADLGDELWRTTESYLQGLGLDD